MTDRFTANLPSADFDRTVAFYGALGLQPTYRDRAWMILKGAGLELEFFAAPIDPYESWHGVCLRVDDLDSLHLKCSSIGLATDEKSIPRLGAPKVEASGIRIFYMVDPDGSLIRCIDNKYRR